MRTLMAVMTVMLSTTVAQAADKCRDALIQAESASRSAQEALLVARAKNSQPDVAAELDVLSQAAITAKAACGNGVASTGGTEPENDDALEFRALDSDDAPKGRRRLERSQRGY